MTHHWKCLDLEIKDFSYHYHPTPSGGTKPSQTSNPQTCRDYKSFRYTYLCYIIGKVLTWIPKIFIISMIRHPQVKLFHLKHQNLKHVEIIKNSDKAR